MSLTLLLSHGWLALTLFIWVALSVGSFLNVAIYRMPVMLQREWRAASGRGARTGCAGGYRAGLQSDDASLPLSELQNHDCGAVQHPPRQLACAARPLRALRGADIAAISARRAAHGRRVDHRRREIRLYVARRCRARVHVGSDRADVHRHRYEAAAGPDHAAAAVARPDRQRRRVDSPIHPPP